SGRIWGMKHDGQRPLCHRELADTQLAIAAFANTRSGELLIVDHGGGLYRLTRNPRQQAPAPFPRRLSETGLFESVRDQRAAPGVMAYQVNAEGWNDGAVAQRWIAVPNLDRVDYVSGPSWAFPDGTALVQTLALPDAAPEESSGAATSGARRIETRVLLRQQGEWAGYSYRWNDAQDDAELVPAAGADAVIELDSDHEPAHRFDWRFPSRAECLACHSRAANFVLGVSEAQLNRDIASAAGNANQLHILAAAGMFSAPLPKPPDELARLVDPRDPAQELEARVRSYLQVNCSVCHVANGGGNALLELGIATARDQMRLIGARPQHDSFGLANAMLVAPGDPARSILLERLSRRGRGQMPPLVSRHVDDEAVALVRTWIEQLPPTRAFVRDWSLAELLPLLDRLPAGGSTDAGREHFQTIGCADCHRINGAGGSAGPDLSGIGQRVAPRDLLESIVLPSSRVADEYAETLVATDGGHVYSGRIEREDEHNLVLRPTTAGDGLIEIPRDTITERHRAPHSSMPQGMLNVLEPDAIVELLSYVLAAKPGGDPRFEE
ncbi:MAG: c-type cytochrome, partial [Planctomycetaceae bacterium]|nr:c-type cytochrome [Planctomycetaceae bacterium]